MGIHSFASQCCVTKRRERGTGPHSVGAYTHVGWSARSSRLRCVNARSSGCCETMHACALCGWHPSCAVVLPHIKYFCNAQLQPETISSFHCIAAMLMKGDCSVPVHWITWAAYSFYSLSLIHTQNAKLHALHGHCPHDQHETLNKRKESFTLN
jgi:hypothetical protein